MTMERTPLILIVDDNPDEVFIMKRVISKFGRCYGIETASDGREAIARLRNEPLPDLMLLDLKMPGGIQGIEVLQFVRSAERTKCIPVAVVSSSTLEKDIRDSYDAGADLFIHKSIAPDHFTNDLKGAFTSLLKL
jgi:two-component system, response regulator